MWFSMFLKHPGTYFSAIINNDYGYFYMGDNILGGPSFKSSSTVMFIKTNANSDGKLDFHYADNSVSKSLRSILDLEEVFVNTNPVLSVFAGCPIYILGLLLFTINCLAKKRYNIFLLYLPILTIFLVVLAGPCNGTLGFRYVFSIAVCMPIVILLDRVCKENQKNILSNQ